MTTTIVIVPHITTEYDTAITTSGITTTISNTITISVNIFITIITVSKNTTTPVIILP